jgi:hypothetical protein
VDEVIASDQFEVRGPIDGPFTWSVDEGGPLYLIGGGSGMVPLMAMLCHRASSRSSGSATSTSRRTSSLTVGVWRSMVLLRVGETADGRRRDIRAPWAERQRYADSHLYDGPLGSVVGLHFLERTAR